MNLFWSELKFFYKRRVKAWSLFYGVPLCAYIFYAVLELLRTDIHYMHILGSLYGYKSPLEFYSSYGFWLAALLPCMALNVSKVIATLRPNEVNMGTGLTQPTGPNDSSVWPPRPKPPMSSGRLHIA